MNQHPRRDNHACQQWFGHQDRNGFAYATRDTTKDLLNPQLGNLPTINPVPTSLRYTTAKDVSVFVSDRLWLTDQWSVTAGVRQAYYEVDQTATTRNAAAACRGATIAEGARLAAKPDRDQSRAIAKEGNQPGKYH